MPDLGGVLDAHLLGDALEAAQHLVAVGVVGDQVGDLLGPELAEGVAADRARRHVRVQRLVEGVFGEVRRLVDGVGLADRVVDHAALRRDLVDRELHRGRQRAAHEVDLLVLDQLQRARRRLAGIELVVAHQELGLAPVEAAALVEDVDGELGAAHLVVGLGAVGAGERHREADLDRPLLRARDVNENGRAAAAPPAAAAPSSRRRVRSDGVPVMIFLPFMAFRHLMTKARPRQRPSPATPARAPAAPVPA